MKKFVVKASNGDVKAMFDDRHEARVWLQKNDKFGDYVLYPMIVSEDGSMEPTTW